MKRKHKLFMMKLAIFLLWLFCCVWMAFGFDETNFLGGTQAEADKITDPELYERTNQNYRGTSNSIETDIMNDPSGIMKEIKRHMDEAMSPWYPTNQMIIAETNGLTLRRILPIDGYCEWLLVTNWTAVSITRPEPIPQRYDTYDPVSGIIWRTADIKTWCEVVTLGGRLFTNLVAHVRGKAQFKDVLLDSIPATNAPAIVTTNIVHYY